MSRVAVIGSSGSCEVFRALGAEVFTVATPDEAKDLLNRLESDYAVVFITEDVAPQSEFLAKKNLERDLPAITLLPVAVSQDKGLAKLKRAVEKAVGADILGLGGE
ncbi:MAG: V-type ATP synthase subunit F [Firmicutes bacterium]|nr:V-type ATP synthase subunit F [Bacillota bacterium]